MIGCFYVNSVLSHYFQKIERFSWDSYMDDCLDLLLEEKVYATDVFFVQLVKLRLVVERVSQAPWNDGQAQTGRAPAVFYVKALQERFREVKNGIPSELLQDSR